MTTAITPRSLEIFLAYAREALNWDSEVPWNGHGQSTKADTGNLTQLKIAGLVTTRVDDTVGDVWLEFTDAGIALAAEHGIEI